MHLDLFSALSDPIRLRSLALLAEHGELCVCELTHALQASQPKVSKHMATLHASGLVKGRRDAQWVLYSLASDLPQWAREAVVAAVKGVSGGGTPPRRCRTIEGNAGASAADPCRLIFHADDSACEGGRDRDQA